MADPNTVCLDENKHSTDMMRKIKLMADENYLCDFIIQVGNDQYHVHRSVLSAGSEYFRAMLKHETKEKQNGKVEMKEVDSECVKSCIDFIYSGKLRIPEGKICALLHLVFILGLDEVKTKLCSKLEESLDVKNFYDIRNVADRYGLQDIGSNVKQFYAENILDISEQPEFQNETESHLAGILESRTTKLFEKDKLDLVLKWFGDDPNKSEIFLRLLKLIQLDYLRPKCLKNIFKNNLCIRNDPELRKIINDATRRVENGIEDELEGSSVMLFDMDSDRLKAYDSITGCRIGIWNTNFSDKLNFTAVTLDSHIYILSSKKSVYRLEFRNKNSNWEKLQSTIWDHEHMPPIISLSGSLFIVGSRTSDDAAKIVEKYEPSQNTWTRMNDTPVAMFGARLVSLRETIFCIAGTGERDKPVKLFGSFTPSSEEWANLEPMRKVATDCGAAAVEDKIYVMGGFDEFHDKSNEVACYNVNFNQWTYLTPMISVHGFPNVYFTNDSLFVVDRGSSTEDIEKYDMRIDRWSKVDLQVDEKFKIYDSAVVKLG